MISNLSSASQIFLGDLARLQQQSNRAQQQISSGFQVETAADAPDQIGYLLQLESQLAANTQAGTNLANVKAEVDTGESALSTAIQLLDQAGSLGAQGAGSTATAAGRTGFAAQVQAIQEQLVRITGTATQGRFIFGGDQDQSAPYQLNLANPNGVDRLTITQGTRQIQDASGASFSVAQTAQDIFDHRNPDDSLGERQRLRRPEQLALGSRQQRFSRHYDRDRLAAPSAAWANSQLSSYGLAQDRVSAASDAQQSQAVSLKAQIATIRDADVTEAILTLTAANNQQQAALAGEAKVSKNSLFSYLG